MARATPLEKHQATRDAVSSPGQHRWKSIKLLEMLSVCARDTAIPITPVLFPRYWEGTGKVKKQPLRWYASGCRIVVFVVGTRPCVECVRFAVSGFEFRQEVELLNRDVLAHSKVNPGGFPLNACGNGMIGSGSYFCMFVMLNRSRSFV